MYSNGTAAVAVNGTLVVEEVAASLSPTMWGEVEFRSFYDQAVCLANNVTYEHRVDEPGSFNYCTVPLSGPDAFLFASMALLVASVCTGKLSAIWMLIIGGCFGLANYYENMLRLSNAIALWLGIQPPDLFFYAFLPPLLVDAALRMDFYIFKKISVHIVVLAYVMVIVNALVLTPFILFGLGFAGRGMDWVHGAILAAMLAPTDAVAVTALLKAGGGPELIVTLMEGEALFNDASGVTLYVVFMSIMENYPADDLPTVTSLIPLILREIVRLTAIGCGTALAFGYATGWLLQWLRWRCVPAFVEALTTVTLAYLLFYVTQGPAQGSGVIAVCVYGLYGSATHHWGKLATDEESGVQTAVWDSVSYVANALVFFWAGIAAVNLVARSTTFLNATAWSYAAIPIIFIFMFICRFLLILLFNPLFNLTGTSLTLAQISFATVGGLRGSLSLIMTADFIINSNFLNGSPTVEENADIVLWVATFVLLTLLINAPMMSKVMEWTGLGKVTDEKVAARRQALQELEEFTKGIVRQLGEEKDEFLQGANWSVVLEFVDHSQQLKDFVPKKKVKGRPPEEGLLSRCGLLLRRRRQLQGAISDAGVPRRSAVQLGADKPGDGEEDGLVAPQAGVVMEVPFLPRKPSAADVAVMSPPWTPRATKKAVSHLELVRVNVDVPGSQPHRKSVMPLVQQQQAMAPGGVSQAARAAAAPGTGSAADLTATAASPTGRVQFRSLPDVLSPGSGGKPVVEAARRGPAAAHGAATPPVLEEETGAEEVEVLWSHAHNGESDEFASRYDRTLPPPQQQQQPAAQAPPAASAVQQPAVSGEALAAQLRRQFSSVHSAAAQPAGVGSDRDLLGRKSAVRASLQGRGSRQGAGADVAAERPAQPLAEALMERANSKKVLASRTQQDYSADAFVSGGRPGTVNGLEGLSSAALRHRIMIGLQRYALQKRLAGLLSTTGLRVLRYSCERSIEQVEKDEEAPMDLWKHIEQEIRGGWLTWLLSRTLASTLRSHRSSPHWWRVLTKWPFEFFTGLLRRQLGTKMLTACEVSMELAMGLTWSAQVQWVYENEDTPQSLLDELNEELQQAYDFIADREAEASYQFQAIQSYRAAMAVLRQQRTFAKLLYDRAVVDDGERDTLLGVIDRKIRQLDITGPTWRPPTPQQVAQGLPFLRDAPADLLALFLKRSKLRELKEHETVLSIEGRPTPDMTAAAPVPAPRDGFYAVVAGVVATVHMPPSDSEPREQLKGVGTCFGVLAALTGTPLPGLESVVALGNSFGRGPLVLHFPQACVEELGKWASGGDPAAQEAELALYRLAGLHVLENIESDVQQAVRAYLQQHRPLGKYAGQQPGRDLEDRALRYTSQVLLDMLHHMSQAELVRLRQGQLLQQGSHIILLQGSVTPGNAAADELASAKLHAPGLVPWLSRTRFSFVAKTMTQIAAWVGGPEGATLLLCSQR